MKNQFPDIGSLQHPCLAERLAMEQPKGKFVQILNTSNSHRFTVSNVGCPSGSIVVYDSLHMTLSSTMQRVVADLVMTKNKVIPVKYGNMQMQSGGSDCRVFALAFATALCHGVDPEMDCYDQSQFRKHFKACLLANKITHQDGKETETAMSKKRHHRSILCLPVAG